MHASPAQVYQELFVPALFAPWAETVAAAAGVGAGHEVLDVACGTGALARAVVPVVGPSGRVAGLDANPEMLAVAEQVGGDITWIEGRAEQLPFAPASFDRVISQFGFMFFEDPVGSLTEMQRVLRPGGRLAVAVCDALDHSPGYAVLTELLHRLFGPEVAAAFRAPFASGDRDRLLALGHQAGLGAVTVQRHEGAVSFASISDLVAAERACAWTLGGLLDEVQFERLLAAAEESLAPFADAAGRVTFSMPSLVLCAEAA